LDKPLSSDGKFYEWSQSFPAKDRVRRAIRIDNDDDYPVDG